MSETVSSQPQNSVHEMQGLIHDIHRDGYGDVEAIRRFIILYEEHFPRGVDPNSFYESLDSPEVGLMFGEGVFDEVVDAYNRLGGSQAAVRFPETGREPSLDWEEELRTLEDIFAHPKVAYAPSHALYVRKYINELSGADTDGTRLNALLANPQLLSGLVSVYDFESESEADGGEPLPDTWPDMDDNFIYTVLRAVGYKYADSIHDDWTYTVEGVVHEALVSNLNAIANLEAARPGATKYLSEQFGIHHFSRYPTELLMQQFDSAGRAGRPYGIVVSAVNDHNGAFSDYWLPDTSTAGRLYAQANVTHDLLVAEAESKNELEQRLTYFDDLNGDRFKIDFALVETHGSHDSVVFGTARHLGSLALRDRLASAHTIFSSRSSVLLTGCATGYVGGIAQSLSRQLNTTVVAPSATTATNDVVFNDSSEGIRLRPVYNSAVPRVYRAGERLGPQETADYLGL